MNDIHDQHEHAIGGVGGTGARISSTQPPTFWLRFLIMARIKIKNTKRICSSSSGSSSDSSSNSSSDSEAEPQLVAARYVAADIAFGLTQRYVLVLPCMHASLGIPCGIVDAATAPAVVAFHAAGSCVWLPCLSCRRCLTGACGPTRRSRCNRPSSMTYWWQHSNGTGVSPQTTRCCQWSLHTRLYHMGCASRCLLSQHVPRLYVPNELQLVTLANNAYVHNVLQ